MSPDLLSVVAIACAAVVILVSLHAAFRLSLNTKMFLKVVESLLREENRARAVKLSHVVNAPVAMVTRRALELRLPRFDPDGPAGAGDYRQAPEDDLRERAVLALDAEAARQLRRYRPSLWVTPLALGCLVVLAAPGSVPLYGWAALGAGLLAALVNVRRWLRARRDLVETVDRLAPWVLPE